MNSSYTHPPFLLPLLFFRVINRSELECSVTLKLNLLYFSFFYYYLCRTYCAYVRLAALLGFIFMAFSPHPHGLLCNCSWVVLCSLKALKTVCIILLRG